MGSIFQKTIHSWKSRVEQKLPLLYKPTQNIKVKSNSHFY